MSDITLLGLGAMGSAIGRALLENGCDLTVWNRSPGRTEEFARQGAHTTDTLKQAIESSRVILICIHGYAATREMLDDTEIRPLLEGRSVVQMSTGTPAQARAAEKWINAQGGRYLDCAVMVYPQSVGTPAGQLLVSGARETYDDCARFIDHLGGDIRYLGAAIGSAAALDLAVVTRLVANTVAIVYGAYLCESEGLPLSQFAGVYPEGDRARHLAGTIDKDDFDDDIEATVATSIEVVSAIRDLAVDSGVNSELPDFILGLYQRAAAGGCLKQDNAALIKVFRGAC